MCLRQKHHGNDDSKALVLERDTPPKSTSSVSQLAGGRLCCRNILAGNLPLNFARCSTDFNAFLVKQSENQYNWDYQLIRTQGWRRELLKNIKITRVLHSSTSGN